MQELIKDLIDLQADLPKVEKTGKNPHFGNAYMTLEDVTAAMLPVLKAHNFAWVTAPDTAADGSPSLSYCLYHSSGQMIKGDMKLILSKQDPQGQGSAITYARRYALCAVTGLVADLDDDGNAASQPEVKKPMYAKKESSLDFDGLVEELRIAMAKQSLYGLKATQFSQEHIGKPKPETVDDVNRLLLVLNEDMS